MGFRAGGERASVALRTYEADTVEHVLTAAAALGLRPETVPSERFYDHVLIGGLLRGCLVRARLAAELVNSTIEASQVCGLGSFRPTTEAESELAAELRIGSCPDEFSAMDIAVRAAFDLTDPGRKDGKVVPGQPHASFLTKEYQGPNDICIGVIAAPSSDPARRANTTDTCTFWADNFAHPRPDQKILLVTTELFVPFQHCTVNYLQEVRSAIRSMRSLYLTVHLE